MIKNGFKWHYLTLKSIATEDGYMRPIQSISGLFNKITSTNTTNDHFCLNCSHSYRTENKFKKHELVCNNNYYCEKVLPNEKEKVTKMH